LVDVDEAHEPIFSLESEVDVADNPNQIIETQFRRVGVSFPQPGEYRLQLFGAGQFLRERRIWVLPYAQSLDSEGEES
jgi:hypothetical protein